MRICYTTFFNDATDACSRSVPDDASSAVKDSVPPGSGGAFRRVDHKTEIVYTRLCRMIYDGSVSFFSLGLEDAHAPTFWPLLMGPLDSGAVSGMVPD